MNASGWFAKDCADLKRVGYSDTVLTEMINFLMTELWDHGFSQTEIRAAFESALQDMNRYAAGEEKR